MFSLSDQMVLKKFFLRFLLALFPYVKGQLPIVVPFYHHYLNKRESTFPEIASMIPLCRDGFWKNNFKRFFSIYTNAKIQNLYLHVSPTLLLGFVIGTTLNLRHLKMLPKNLYFFLEKWFLRTQDSCNCQ